MSHLLFLTYEKRKILVSRGNVSSLSINQVSVHISVAEWKKSVRLCILRSDHQFANTTWGNQTWLLFALSKQSNVFLSLFCTTYVFTCHSQSSLAEFPECWLKPAAELSTSTSDAFTVPCSQPSEYFPKPSLAWLLHSTSSQVFGIACVRKDAHTHMHILSSVSLPTTVESSRLFPSSQLDFSHLFTPPCSFPLAPSSSSFFLKLLIFLWFFPSFF